MSKRPETKRPDAATRPERTDSNAGRHQHAKPNSNLSQSGKPSFNRPDRIDPQFNRPDLARKPSYEGGLGNRVDRGDRNGRSPGGIGSTDRGRGAGANGHDLVRPPRMEKNGQLMNPADRDRAHNLSQMIRHVDRRVAPNTNRLANTDFGRRLHLADQIRFRNGGDLGRRLNLNQQVQNFGGWRKRPYGRLSSNFTSQHFGFWYSGGGVYPNYCWAPRWNPWVDWTWWNNCDPVWDPRPAVVRPVVYDPCGAWGGWNLSAWQPLPMVSCGTWVDVPPVMVNQGVDLQLLAVRFVDSGHPERDLGPRYRVWFRNNSNSVVTTPFNVMLIASDGQRPLESSPKAGVRIPELEPGVIRSADVRLPADASGMVRNSDGFLTPFTTLHVLVDANRETSDFIADNNGAIVARTDILPIDPAVFAADSVSLTVGEMVNLAGEGLGPEPGQVLVLLDNLEFQAEIEGWYDLGVRIRMPAVPIANEVQAEILVIRGDGAAANPLPLTISPAGYGVPPRATP